MNERKYIFGYGNILTSQRFINFPFVSMLISQLPDKNDKKCEEISVSSFDFIFVKELSRNI